MTLVAVIVDSVVKKQWKQEIKEEHPEGGYL
jgi:hypothetical protein